jgi:hypothetical protein
MMDSLMQGIGQQKMQGQHNALNNTITGNMGTYNTFGNTKNSIDGRKTTAIAEKTPNSALNSRNWRNKSIDTTPEQQDHYQYQVAKRAGSTAVGERQHTQTIPMSKNQNLNATTDYSYHIGPSQYKQSSTMNVPSSGGPRHAQKFADLKFHHTAIDFNKTQQAGNTSLNSTLQTSHQNNQPIKSGNKYSGTKKQFDLGSNLNQGTTAKKTNHSVDLGGRAPSNNAANQNIMMSKNAPQSHGQAPSNVGQQMIGNFTRPFNANHSQMHPVKMN